MKSKTINELISNIHLKYKRYLEQQILTYGLSIKQYYLLKQLKNKELTPAIIADKLFADRPTVTVIINNLKKKGFVEVRNHPKDKRSKIITISKDGLLKLNQLRDIEMNEIDLTSCLNNNEKEMSKTLLKKILQNLNNQIQLKNV